MVDLASAAAAASHGSLGVLACLLQVARAEGWSSSWKGAAGHHCHSNLSTLMLQVPKEEASAAVAGDGRGEDLTGNQTAVPAGGVDGSTTDAGQSPSGLGQGSPAGSIHESRAVDSGSRPVESAAHFISAIQLLSLPASAIFTLEDIECTGWEERPKVILPCQGHNLSHSTPLAAPHATASPGWEEPPG